jgi:hypothetical protein
MTFGEIYDAVCLNVWGESVPPVGGAARLQGAEGIIANMHRDIQVDYNYWFMQTWSIITSIAGTQAYTLPIDMKDIISLLWAKEDTTATYTYFTDPLTIISNQEAHLKWKDNNNSTEYPMICEIIDGQGVVLYPIPEESGRELHVIYYAFLDRPGATTFTTDTDLLTQFGAEAIIALSSAKMLRILQEVNQANVFDLEAKREIELLKKEDYRRRQSNLESVHYRGV